MIKVFSTLAVLVIFASVVKSHQSNPFQPFQHYLKSTEKFGVLTKEDVKYRLGSETKPSFYDIKLKFDIVGGPVFDGDVEITFQATKSGLSSVVLNAEDVTIKEDEVGIHPKGNTQVNYYKLKSLVYDRVYQKITFDTTTPLNSTTDYVIKILYTGNLQEDLHGVYLSDYKEGTDTKKLITTHFGQFARRMMPCWDEPQFKAQFKFTITRNLLMKSVSNAVKENSVGNVDYFKATSVISPYILALVVSEFELTENAVEKFGVISRYNATADTAYALEVGPKLIKAFDEWTDMPYLKLNGVEKMQLGAIPDFLAVSIVDNKIVIFHIMIYCFVYHIGCNGELGFDSTSGTFFLIQQRLCKHGPETVDSYCYFSW